MLVFTKMWETYRLAGWVAVMKFSSQLDMMNLAVREVAWLERQVDSLGGGSRLYD